MSGCRSTKRLNKTESLITKLTVKGIEEEFSEQAKSYVSLDIRPNSRFNLWVYNNFSNKGKKKLGEAPHLLDSSLVEVSRKQIEGYLNIKGFLNAKVESNIKFKNKKAEIIYTAKPGSYFKFRNITFDIPDSALKTIYLANRGSFTHIKSGARYDTDSIAFEREKIFLLMKQNGYYDFVRQYVRPTVDTNFNKGVADMKLGIINPPNNGKHQVYTLENAMIRIQPSSGLVAKEMVPDSAFLKSQYKFYDYSHFFRPRKLVPYIFLKKGEKYNIYKSDLTVQRMFDLNVFKNVNVDYIKLDDSTNRLRSVIDIVPLKKKSNRIDGEFTFNSSITGINLGLTYQNRNIFGGAELFEIKLRGGLQFDKNVPGSFLDRIISRDYQFGASLTFPRLLTPFRTPEFVNNAIPKTRIGTSYQIYKLTDSYERRSLATALTYEWIETKYKQHSLSPISIQYAQGLISAKLRSQLEAQGNQFFVATLRSQFISSSTYNYTSNLAKLVSYGNFTFFSGGAELGGNSAALLATISKGKNAEADKTLFGVPYYQFVKLVTDWRFYKSLGGERQFIVRLNPGIGYSYGNVKSLPFDKQFFAGGSSGVRAWQARTLGPGNYNRASLSSDSSRNNLRNLDQIGDMKFEGNLEYRFKLINNFFGTKLKGATFIDFGNVWQLRETGFEGAKVKFNKLFDQTAIGMGFGLRFDLSYFVFRLDAGFKFKDPQFEGADQYVFKYWYNKGAKRSFKNDYSISNSPDRYSLSQIQFGIGLPF